jgi:TRAP-type C4-dicarboxylate transport system permease small subunit
MTTLSKALKWVDHAFTAVAATALAVMTLLVVADVALRYGSGNPIVFAHDVVVLYLTPAVFFFGFGPTFLRDEHLAVDILTNPMPPRIKAVSAALSAGIGLWIFSLLIWVSWGRAYTSFMRDEVIASIIPWPAWASYMLVPIGSTAMLVVCVAKLFFALQAIWRGQNLPQSKGSHV